MNMCLLEVTMCKKCRSSHFQSEGGGSKKNLGLGGGANFTGGGGGQYSITCHGNRIKRFEKNVFSKIRGQLPYTGIQTFTNAQVTCTQMALRVHKNSCAVLIPLRINSLNLPISHTERYALRK